MINDIRAPKERRFRERVDFMETLDDLEFISRFRVSKISFMELLNAIEPLIAPTTQRHKMYSIKANF